MKYVNAAIANCCKAVADGDFCKVTVALMIVLKRFCAETVKTSYRILSFFCFLLFSGPHHKGRIRGSQVSRPPSSHITRVDEEQSGADGRKSGARSVETVDRGVGPTPRPPPLPPAGATEPRVPPYISFQPFPDSRNGLLEAAYGWFFIHF